MCQGESGYSAFLLNTTYELYHVCRRLSRDFFIFLSSGKLPAKEQSEKVPHDLRGTSHFLLRHSLKVTHSVSSHLHAAAPEISTWPAWQVHLSLYLQWVASHATSAL
jgi:hypothetical protein